MVTKFLLADDAKPLSVVLPNLANRVDGSILAAGRWLCLSGPGCRICCSNSFTSVPSTCCAGFSKNPSPPPPTLPPSPLSMLVLTAALVELVFDGLLLQRPSPLIMSVGLLHCCCFCSRSSPCRCCCCRCCCFEAGWPGARAVIESMSFVITVFLSRPGEDWPGTEWATGTAVAIAAAAAVVAVVAVMAGEEPTIWNISEARLSSWKTPRLSPFQGSQARTVHTGWAQ